MADAEPTMTYEATEVEDAELSRYRKPGSFWTTTAFVLTVFALALAVNEIFRLKFFKITTGNVLVTQQYIYLVLGVMLALVFIVMPAHKKAPRRHIPWYDIVLFGICVAMTGYFTYFGRLVSEEAWEYNAPDHASYVAVAFWALVLEAGRRGGGWPVFAVCVTVSLFPTIADLLPAAIAGVPSTLMEAAAYHIYSEESVLGIPMRAFALLVVGFLLFGNALVYTGG